MSELARECKMRLYQTSVKENLNVCNVFLHLAENYVNQVKTAALLAASPYQIGGGSSFQQQGKKKKRGAPHVTTPQEYLSNPMFDSLSSSSSSSSSSGGGGGGGGGGRGRGGFIGRRTWNLHHLQPSSSSSSLSPYSDRGTIVLRPLSHLKKKQRSLSMRLPDVAQGCKVL